MVLAFGGPHLNLREQAVSHARRGFFVFRVHVRGNTPAFEGWQDEATNNPDLAHKLWTSRAGKEMPYNIGIATGRPLPGGGYLAALDVDVKNGKEGDKSLRFIEAVSDEAAPPTLRSRTPSDGWHDIYASAEPLPNSVGAIAPGLDVRGAGGYIVAPGSVRNGKSYDIVADLPIAPAPAFMRTARPVKPSAAGDTQQDSPQALDRARDYLERSAPEAIEGSGGNNTTYRVAAKLNEYNLGFDTAAELLRDWNDAKAFPPWDDDALMDILRSAIKHAQNAPGAILAENEFGPVQVKERLKGGINLEPVIEFDAVNIPKRQWVLGGFAAKHYLSGIVSPPGVGKTTFLLMVAVAIAAGRDDIVGMKVHQRGRVLLWNQEDETDELKRRLLALMAAFDVKWSDIEFEGKPGIILGSGVDRRLMFATRDSNGRIAPAPDAATMTAYIAAEGICTAIFDPFVEMHAANENDNTEVAVVGSVFRKIAVKADCAVMLAHHTRKPPAATASDAYAGNMDTARGAGALNGVARMVATLYSIDAATGKKYGIPEDECRRYIRFDDAKANMSLVSGEPMFFRREGVTIGGFGGEEVGVLRPVKLSRTKDAKISARDSLVRDVLEAMGDAAARPVTDLAKDISALPMRADMSLDALGKAIKKTFEQGVKGDKNDNYDIEIRRVAGKTGRYACVYRTLGQQVVSAGGDAEKDE